MKYLKEEYEFNYISQVSLLFEVLFRLLSFCSWFVFNFIFHLQKKREGKNIGERVLSVFFQTLKERKTLKRKKKK